MLYHSILLHSVLLHDMMKDFSSCSTYPKSCQAQSLFLERGEEIWLILRKTSFLLGLTVTVTFEKVEKSFVISAYFMIWTAPIITESEPIQNV